MSICATSPLTVVVRHVFCRCFFFFSLPVMLPSEIPKLPTDPPVRGFSTVSKLLLHNSLPGQVSIPNSFAFLSFIFCPTSFRRECVAFLGVWCPPPVFRSCFVYIAQHLNDLLMNMWGRKWSPCPILPSWDHPSTAFFKINLWLRWVFVAAHGLSLVAASGGYSSLQFMGFSLWGLLLLNSTGSRARISSCGSWV